MNIGEPKRELEIQPVTIPVPERVPMPSPSPHASPSPPACPPSRSWCPSPPRSRRRPAWSRSAVDGRALDRAAHRVARLEPGDEAGRPRPLAPARRGRAGGVVHAAPVPGDVPSAGVAGPELAQHPSPVPGCTCGIYASSSLRNLVTSTPSMPAVSAVGTVALWGRVIEHERGWRAEFAYPDRLTLVCVVCLQEGSGAGEPAFVVAEPVASGPYPAVAVCRDHAASVTAEGSRVISPAAVIRSALLDRYAVDLMPFDTVRSLFERDPVPVPFTRPSSPTPVPARQVPARVAPAGSAATPAAPPVATPAPTPVRPEPLRPTRPGPPSIGRRIARGIGQAVMFVLQAAFFLLMAAWGLGSCVMTVLPSDAATSPAPVFVPEPEVTDPSTLAVIRQPPDRDAPVFPTSRSSAASRTAGGSSWSRASGRGARSSDGRPRRPIARASSATSR